MSESVVKPIRYGVRVEYKGGDTATFYNVLEIPVLRGGVLVIDTADGQWVRIPSENVQNWNVYAPGAASFIEMYDRDTDGRSLEYPPGSETAAQ